MTNILYYSPSCNYCKDILIYLKNKPNLHSCLHFIDITDRVKDGNKTYVILKNSNNKILIPSNVKNIPCMVVLEEGTTNNICIFGDNIYTYLRSLEKKEVTQNTNTNTNNNIINQIFEPNKNEEMIEANFNNAIDEMKGYSYDNTFSSYYASLDANMDETKFARLDANHTITTPEESVFGARSSNPMTIDKILQLRNDDPSVKIKPQI